MIGGIDVPIRTRAGDLSLEVAVRAVRQKWPRAVFENGTTGERYNHFWEIPFGGLRELFVYRDPTAADLWDAEGAIPAASNTMVHLLADEGWITAVVDEKTPEIEEVLAGIRSGLEHALFVIPAQFLPEAA
jgi:hypothetical protein